MILWLTQAALADCTTPGSPERIRASILAAEQAFVELEVEQVVSHTDDVLAEVTCLDGPIDAELMIAVHRAMGLRANIQGEESAAKRAFAASRYLDPDRPLPSHIATGPEYPVWRDFHAIPLEERAKQPLYAPRRGTVYVDGQETLSSAERWPMLFQYVDSKGELTAAYAWPEDPLPTYPVRNPNAGPVALSLSSLALAGVGVGLAAHGWNWVQQVDTGPEHNRYKTEIYIGYGVLGAAGGGLLISNIWAMRNGQKMSADGRR